MKLDGKKDKNNLLDETEIHSILVLIRQFNWLVSQTRPDILFKCCYLLGKIKNSTTDDTKRANKLVNKISEQIVVTLKKEDNLADPKQLVLCDASRVRQLP